MIFFCKNGQINKLSFTFNMPPMENIQTIFVTAISDSDTPQQVKLLFLLMETLYVLFNEMFCRKSRGPDIHVVVMLTYSAHMNI